MSHTEVIVTLMVERRELYSDVKTRVLSESDQDQTAHWLFVQWLIHYTQTCPPTYGLEKKEFIKRKYATFTITNTFYL